jgi:tRNA(fMet)-specific endonuclease VapC
VARVILDTGVLIETSRQRLDLGSLIARDDVAVPAIVLAEYMVGIDLDTNQARQSVQRSFLDALMTTTPVEDYTPKVVPHHIALIMYARNQGRPRGTFDLIIAAIARATDRTLLTTDAKAGFEELPGVQARVITN